MTRVPLVLLVVLVGSLSVRRVQAAQAVVRDVSGEVHNGTPGGMVPEGLTVTLHVFSDMEETDVCTTTLTAGSAFRFEDVSLEQGQTVIARTVYEDVSYLSEFGNVESGEEAISLPITVYETAEDSSDVAVAQLHVFLDRVGEQLQVTQYAVLTNVGDRTYVGSARSETDRRATWSASLPSSAEGLRFEGGEAESRFLMTGSGFIDTRPIPPGQGGVEASFTYDLPYSEGLQIDQAFDLPLNSVVLVLPGEELGLEGPGLSSEGTLETQMGPAVSYTAGPLEAGAPLSFTVIPRGAEEPDAGIMDQSGGLAVGIVAIIGAAMIVYFLWGAPRTAAVPADALPQLEAIVALDLDFEKGEMSEKTYRKKRRALKRRLRSQLSSRVD